jgi:hypothetical protein
VSEPAAAERRRVAAELERSKAELASSLRALEARVERTFSPGRVLEAHLGWLLVGAFALGAGLAAWTREER